MVPDDGLLEAWPGVRLDADNAAYYAGLLERRLLVNRCRACGTWHHPPRSICPRCWSTDVEPCEVSGRGRVVLSTVLRQGPSRGGADYRAGHSLVAVELEEQAGLRVSGTVVGTPADEVTVGLPVQLTWPEGPGALDLLRFRVAQR